MKKANRKEKYLQPLWESNRTLFGSKPNVISVLRKGCNCCCGRARTCNLMIQSHPLYQLRYAAVLVIKFCLDQPDSNWHLPNTSACVPMEFLTPTAFDYFYTIFSCKTITSAPARIRIGKFRSLNPTDIPVLLLGRYLLYDLIHFVPRKGVEPLILAAYAS